MTKTPNAVTPVTVASNASPTFAEHELALQPRDRIPGRIVGAPLGHRAMIADRRQRRAGSRLEVPGTVASQHVTDCTVHDDVGIAPDGRGEVHVGAVCESEMSDVARRIRRQRQGAQQHGLDELRVGPRRGILDDFGEVAGLAERRPRRASARARRGRPAAPATLSADGPSWMRKSPGSPVALPGAVAAATLAATMHSSMIRCATLRTTGSESFHPAVRTEHDRGSPSRRGRWPRARRGPGATPSYASLQPCRAPVPPLRASRARPRRPVRAPRDTSVYVRRARERITPSKNLDRWIRPDSVTISSQPRQSRSSVRAERAESVRDRLRAASG